MTPQKGPMSNSKTKKQPVEKLETPTVEERLQSCDKAIREALAEHGCKIVTYFREPELVGKHGSKMILEASYGLTVEERS